MTEETDLLRQILQKLDAMVAIQRLTNRSALDALRAELESDKVAKAILEHCTYPVPYSDLVAIAARDSGANERTVKRRISELSERGLISSLRRGQQVFYENSGIV